VQNQTIVEVHVATVMCTLRRDLDDVIARARRRSIPCDRLASEVADVIQRAVGGVPDPLVSTIVVHGIVHALMELEGPLSLAFDSRE
jgi:hypothetical protein